MEEMNRMDNNAWLCLANSVGTSGECDNLERGCAIVIQHLVIHNIRSEKLGADGGEVTLDEFAYDLGRSIMLKAHAAYRRIEGEDVAGI
jgi:hypothetical protein